MAQVRGTQVVFGLFNETTYAQVPGAPSGERAYMRTSNLRGSIARIMDETLSGYRGMPPSIAGNTDVQGSIPTVLAPQSCMRWLAHLIGVPTTTGAGPYEHVFAVGTGALELPPGLLIEADMGPALAAPNRYIRFHGCRIGQAQMRFQPSGFVEANYDIRGSYFTNNAGVALDASLDDFGHRGFSMFTATMERNGAPIANVADYSVTWSNDLDDSLFVIGGGGRRGALPEGFARISGQLTALYNDSVLLNDAIASNELSLSVTLQNGTGDGSAGNEYFNITVPHLFLEATTPEVPGPRGLRNQFNWSAHRDGSNEIAATVTVRNARATY